MDWPTAILWSVFFVCVAAVLWRFFGLIESEAQGTATMTTLTPPLPLPTEPAGSAGANGGDHAA